MARLSLDEKAGLLTGNGLWTMAPCPEIGLAGLVWSNGPVGVHGADLDGDGSSPLLPCPSALAATWDPGLAERAGRLLGTQARAQDVHVLLAPGVNLHRSPLAGRHFEYFSEDPLLTARMAVAYIQGVQACGVAACVKHFVCNEQETERMSHDVRVGEADLRERYLPPFEAAVRDGGVWTVMAAYNRVNGTAMTEHRELVRGLLKGEWGFDGVVVSDWCATRSTEAAAEAGLDVAMPGPEGLWGRALADAVRGGRLDEAVLDDQVQRLLRLAGRVGALPDAAPESPAAEPAEDLCRTIAARSFVLLENPAGLLPLEAGQRIALIGPAAERPCAQGGGSATVIPPRQVTTPANVLRAVTVHRGTPNRRLLPPLPAGPARDPETGAAGVRVEHRDGEGRVLGTESRTGAMMRWLPGELPDGTAQIAVRFLLAVAEPGQHSVSVMGLGPFEVDVAGEPVLRADLGAPIADYAELLHRPPHAVAEVPAEPGRPVLVEIRHPAPLGFAHFAIGYDVPRPADAEAEIAAAVRAAAEAEVAVVCVGTADEHESEGYDRTSLTLPGRQDELVRRVAAANPRTVVVVNTGGPVLMPWAKDVGAVLWTWFGGQEYGGALADVLLGVSEPGGRLPTALPVSGKDCASVTPVDGVVLYGGERAGRSAYPFGHGLGYTTWSYEKLVAEPDAGGGMRVRVQVRNTGERAGREVVQCYARPEGGGAAKLAGFAAVELGPGETGEVSIEVAARTLSSWRPGAGWTPWPDGYELRVGRSMGDPGLCVG